MRDYSSWKRKTCKVTGLLLDAKNPRIPPAGPKLSQSELIAALVEHDDVYGLAKSIVESGYFPTEPLVAVEEDGEKVVVEGNRRLAALKVLISPESAPEKYRRRFKSLSVEVTQGALDQVDTYIAPSRAEATPLIIERHKRSHLQKWEPAMKAQFYQTLLDGGATPEELQSNYGITQSELADSLRMHMLYRVACGLDLPADVLAKVRDPRSFPLTSLERVIESVHGREFLRIEPDEKKVFVVKGKPESFKKAFAKIVKDVATHKATSRRLNNAKGIKKYLKQIEDSRPSNMEKGAFAIGDLAKEVTSESPKELPKSAAHAPRQSRSLIPTGVRCFLGSPRICDVFKEVRKLHTNTFPNSSAVMLRVLLEMAVSHRLDRIKAWKDWVESRRTKLGQPDDWYPPLKDQLVWLVDKNVLGLKGLPFKSLKQFAQRRPECLNLDTLNQFAHNPHAMPSQDDLRKIAVVLGPVWDGLLKEQPESEAKGAEDA
jgi:hypothetical protein